MATHAGANSDMSIVYFLLMINDKKKILKTEKEQNYWSKFSVKQVFQKQWPKQNEFPSFVQWLKQ